MNEPESGANEPKRFMLAGLWTEKEKIEMTHNISSLGGKVLDKVQWDPSCTHVIAKSFVMSERIMGALAAGKWVVTRRFLDRSIREKSWQNEKPFVSDDLVLRHRNLWLETKNGVFQGMKVIFLMDDEETKRDVYTRIVVAGGGQVDTTYSLETLRDKMPRVDQVTHVVVDPSILEEEHEYFDGFKLWMEYAGALKWTHNPPFYLYYKFFTDKIKELGSKQVSEQSWSIYKPETQASAKKQRLDAKRQKLREEAKKQREMSHQKRASSGFPEGPSKKQRTGPGPQVVVISDGEASDDEITILEQQYEEEMRNGYNRRTRKKKTIGQNRRQLQSYREQSARGRTTGNVPDLINIDINIEEDEVECIEIDIDENSSPGARAAPSRNTNTWDHEVINLDSDSDQESQEEEPMQSQFSWHQPCAVPIHHRPSAMEVDRDERNDNSDDEVEMTFAHVGTDTESPNDTKNYDREIFTQITDDETDREESDAYSVSDVEESLDTGKTSKIFPLSCDRPKSKESPPISSNSSLILADSADPRVELAKEHQSVSSNQTPSLPNMKESSIVKSVVSKSRDPPFPVTPTPEKEGSTSGSSTSQFQILKSGIVMQPTSTLGGNFRSQQMDVDELVDKKSSNANEVAQNQVSREQETSPVSREQETISDHSDEEEVFSIISTTEDDIQSITSSAEENEPPLSQVDRPQDSILKQQNVEDSTPNYEQVQLESIDNGNRSETKEKTSEQVSSSESETSAPQRPEEVSSSTQETSEIVTSAIDNTVDTVTKEIKKGASQVATREEREFALKPAENTAEQGVSERNILPPPVRNILPPPKVNSKIDGLVTTLLNRQFESDECIAISNIIGRTEKFDKAGEVKAKKHFRIRQMDGKIREEMTNKFEIEAENKNFDQGRKRNKNDDLEDDLFNMADDEKIGEYDLLKSLMMAKFETNLHRYPGSAILNCVIKHYFLMAKSKTVIHEGFGFMKKFLFLHSGREEGDRLRWLELILSSLRDCPVISPFPQFSISNSLDIHDCWRFFRSVLNKVMSSTPKKTPSIADLEAGSDQVDDGYGAAVLLTLLVETMQKDFEIWSKHLRKTQIAGKLTQPLIFYLLGGEKDFDKNRNNAIVLFYSHMVGNKEDASEARRMLAMVALLTSHRDSLEGGANAQLYKGQKIQVAEAVAKGLKEAGLNERDLFVELSLIQPNWFSSLVSKAYCKPTVKLERLEDLVDSLQTLSLKDKNATACIENWVHRSCGFLHWHTLFRANWHYNQYPNKEFINFRAMQVQSGKSVQRSVVKFENDVQVGIKHILGDIKVMRDLHDKKELPKDAGALSSLFFKMKDLYLY